MRSHSGIIWRWAEKDFGFRFRDVSSSRAAEYYQASKPDEYYHVPVAQRKLPKPRIDEIALRSKAPTSPTIVAIPWQDYGNADLQQITTPNGDPCLNWAGCLSKEEIKARETLGVSQAKDFVADLSTREKPAPITLDLIVRVHKEMFGDIYPWAGQWRTVSLHKGDGPTRWPMPPFGIEPVIQDFAEQVLIQTPLISDDNDAVLDFAARFMGDYLAIHPFREGNGRSAFILSELILLQNGLVPMDEFNRLRDELRYFAACDAARIARDYAPLKALLVEWQKEAQITFEKRLQEEDAIPSSNDEP
jgi:cell filamentation protein